MSEKRQPESPPSLQAAAKAPRVMGAARNNIWRFKVVDNAGEPVQSAPGMNTVTIRGPGTRKDAIEAIRLLLDSKRADAVNAGEDDPGYKMADGSLEPLGHTDNDLGSFRPAGAAPLDLPTDAAVRASHEKLIAEKLGTTDNA